MSEAGGLLRKLVHEWDHVELQVEHALLTAGDGGEVLGPRVAVDGLLAARDGLRLPEE